MRTLTAIVLGLGICELSPPALGAQAPTVPRTYSIVETNSMIAPDMTVKVYRDGAKEILLQTRSPSADSPKGYRGGMYYDFQAHFQFTWDATDGTPNCGRQEYADSTAPAQFDVVSGSAEMRADMAKTPPTPGAPETVNGMSATTFTVVDTAQKMSLKGWLADKTDYLLKMTMSANGAPPVTLLEVKSLSFAKPPASVFAFPASCK